MKILNFLKLPVMKTDLNLKNTLTNGQAFNWEIVEEQYVGVLGNLFLIMQYSHDNEIQFQVMNKVDQVTYSRLSENVKIPLENQIEHALVHYFRLDTNLDQLIQEWKQNDQYFLDVASNISGLRMLRQEPLECLISFLVSQNNNIKRISLNLKQIRQTYGIKLGSFGKQDFYQFPSLNQLMRAKVQDLREMGLGYRAEYIVDSVHRLNDLGGEDYLKKLIGQKEEYVLEKLLEFKGVGRKVADCVRLFSLDCDGVVPVDTHVYQIYMNRYKSTSKKKVDSGSYSEVQELFAQKFGKYAGWAHSFLFTAELPNFKDTVKPSLSKTKSKARAGQQKLVEDEATITQAVAEPIQKKRSK